LDFRPQCVTWCSENGIAGGSQANRSVYEAGRNDNTLCVVEISHPVIDRKDLVYQYKLINGAMPKGRWGNCLVH
jgi:hypothetical protein